MPDANTKERALAPVIGIERDKCVNCHACIAACPVKFCNDGSGDFVTLDPSTCIACGTCLTACTHGARYYIDDLQAFLDGLSAGEKVVAITAPSVAANFPDQYLNLNGWLKSIGVEAIFDVSFGAELSVKSYVEHIRSNQPETLIASPCPVVVTYIETYHPELLPYLAPVDSPMGHCMKMIRHHYPQYKDHRIAAISPCIAKKREFGETGMGDYNIGYTSIDRYLRQIGVNLGDFPEAPCDNPPPERAVLFSSPGGLRKSIARWLPEYAEETRTIEGTETLFEYLEKLSESIKEHRAPRLVDCLNCVKGCNGGTLTLAKDLPTDEIEYWIERRGQEMKALYGTENAAEEAIRRVEEQIERFWSEDDYKRNYADRSGNNELRVPTPEEKKEIFHRMHKHSEKDIYNCSSCGYMACEQMAVAIFNGKNRPENCHFYLTRETQISNETNLQRELRFRNILETSLEGFVQINNQKNVEMVNDAFCNMLGYGQDELLGQPFCALFENTRDCRFLENAYHPDWNIRSTRETVLKRKDGSKLTALFSASPLLDTERRRIGLFAMVNDISRLKSTEEELRHSRDELEQRVQERTRELAESNQTLQSEIEHRKSVEDALRESENRLQAIVHGCPIPQFVIDRGHKVISWNRPIEEYSGIRAEEVLGTPLHWRAFYEQERPCLADLLIDGEMTTIQKWYAGKYSASQLIEGAIEATDFFPHMKGDGRWLYFTAALIHDSHGQVIGAVETLEDITERKQAEEARLDLERQVQHSQKLESLGILAGGIAHDFNNLLAGILGNADLALMELSEDSSARSSIELIAATAQRAADLARQMLAYSGKGRFVVTAIDLSAAVREMLHLLEASISKKTKIVCQLSDNLPPIQADTTQIRQVIMNLITNGDEAIGDKAGTITVSTGVIEYQEGMFQGSWMPGYQPKNGRYVYMEVSDTGCGMDDQTLARIFDPFFTTKFTGRGLGLSAVMGIVRGHRGTLDIKSVPDQGTTFKVLFPASSKRKETSGEEPPEKSPPKMHGAILVVDDEASVRQMATQFLSRKGFQVYTAEDGLKGLDLFQEHHDKIRCVILDLTMPNMDGTETLEELQNCDPKVTVLISSGYSDQELERRFSNKGVAGFLPKPYRLEHLLSAIQKAIDPSSAVLT